MANVVKICKKCMENKEEYIKYHAEIFKDFPKDFIDTLVIGYYTSDEEDFCCKIHPYETTIDSKLSYEEFYTLSSISSDYNFMQAMEDLKEKDPIEYQLKMSQFKMQVGQQTQEDNKPKCPKCKSTSITTGARGVNFTWGLLGASKTVNRCANCGHTWKP